MGKRKLKIAMVAKHSCIRVLKESLMLMANGHEVYLITEKIPFGYEMYTNMSAYTSKDHLQRVVRMHTQFVDIFHVHNEPDNIVWETKEASEGKPVIYDIHDLEHLRWKKKELRPKPGEIRAFNAADGVVHVSEACQRAAWEFHAKKPDAVIYSWQPARYTAKDEDILSQPAWGSIIYEGGIDSQMKPHLVAGSANTVQFNIRNWQPVMEVLRKMNFAITIYGANPLNNFMYEEMGCAVHRPIVYPAMLAALRPHGFGLVGCPLSTPLMEYAMPNKLFEYISQGVVPIVVNATEAADFVIKHGIGLVLPSQYSTWTLKTVKDFILTHGPACRKRLLKLRKNFIMETQAETLEGLYHEVLGG
jgi:glycosyltransferase involved in cell wall biosynthesis